ncbi:bifunctional DNA primase/polymerase [Haloquadratum walsbyi]|uniref:bifunctional DNA primase/polymerase n=1 Tax=Haloquadratum walsbyi TaxID=293091 RepID=UPI0015F43FDD|nr:bifunctional DNA primase/polymerase [Haloquadratum walsbyi]
MISIPEQLITQPLIRVCRPECRSHNDCSGAGKRPVTSTNNPRPIGEIRNWIRSGGNYGVVPKADNDLIVLDSDSQIFTELAQDLPETYTVKTGSGNYHFYFYSEFNSNKSFKTQSSEFGSIRADNWHTVGANSVHPDTGEKYQTAIDTEINILSESDISQFINSLENRLESQSSREDGGGGGSAAVFTTKTAEDLEIEPTEQTLRTLGFINSDSKRTQIAKVFDSEHPERQIRVWACSFLYSVVGLTQRQIEKLLRESAEWAYDDNRIEIEIKSLVQNSINNSKADESVNLGRYIDTGDMSSNELESRKTESSGIEGSRLKGGEKTMSTDWNTEVIAQNGSAVCQAGEEHINPDNPDMDSWDTISLLFGSVSEDENFGKYPEWDMNQYGSAATKQLGGKSPKELRLAAEALEKLADELEE